ncbi:(Na+)-NQR maturation NqrM [Roseimaritima ulvae]|uniref:(Na+)-NQR maturation NqrM n=1 Tax=Roseimaritima ulvae TaxID=980254 RepID=A0A5B9QQ55_9BACT|nr:(Na+)-NQR maturation NqrM [Roseimaritima ulvae]QEG41227.1 hypothetical protein UC8_32460 [Roseimaritima ulvae]
MSRYARGFLMSFSVMFLVAGITFAAFLIVIAGMAVGVLFGRRSISGSCGGLANQTDAEGNTSCSLCENPSEACRELKSRMQTPADAE